MNELISLQDTNANQVIPPRNICIQCWINVTFGVGSRPNRNVDAQYVLAILRDFYNKNRDSEGNIIAVRDTDGRQQPTNDNDIILNALFVFLDSFPLSDLFNLLDQRGLSDLADAFCIPPRFGMVVPVSFGQIHSSRRLQLFYYTLKNFVDRNVASAENEFLLDLFRQKVNKFEIIRADFDILSCEANKIALITWLRIQQCKRDTGLIREVLEECKSKWPFGVDKTLMLAFYHSKMAVAYAMDSRHATDGQHRDLAIFHYHMANRDMHLINDPIKVLLLHDRRYVYQLLGKDDYELNNAAENALRILASCDEEPWCDREFMVQLKRMFLLYKAQFCLGIGNDLHIDENIVLDENRMNEANGTLSCFNETSQNGIEVEPRRMMVSNFCMGRFYERKSHSSINGRHDLVLARERLERANLLSLRSMNLGSESGNIVRFLQTVRGMVHHQQQMNG